MGNDNIGRVPAGFKGRERDQFLPDFENLPDLEKMIQERKNEKMIQEMTRHHPQGSKVEKPSNLPTRTKTKQFTNPNGDQ